MNLWNGIVSMINEILSMCRAISEEERNRFQIAKEVIGKCPVCGSDVYEGKTNYYCSDRSCSVCFVEVEPLSGKYEKVDG